MLYRCQNKKPIPRQALDLIPLGERLKRGGQQWRHRKTIEKDAAVMEADYSGARNRALDRWWKRWIAM